MLNLITVRYSFCQNLGSAEVTTVLNVVECLQANFEDLAIETIMILT